MAQKFPHVFPAQQIWWVCCWEIDMSDIYLYYINPPLSGKTHVDVSSYIISHNISEKTKIPIQNGLVPSHSSCLNPHY